VLATALVEAGATVAVELVETESAAMIVFAPINRADTTHAWAIFDLNN